MSECKKIKKELVAYLYGDLEADLERNVTAHLESCPSCRRDLESYRKAGEAADLYGGEAEKVMETIDWENLPRQIVRMSSEQKKDSPRPMPDRRVKAFSSLSMRPVWAALLAGIILGSFLTFLVFRGAGVSPRKTDFSVSAAFMNEAELEAARRETLDYLEKSQYLLLDFVQKPAEELPREWVSEWTSRRVKDLLNRKKYINQQLDNARMAKAKEICDQLEFLFFELAQVSEYLTAEEAASIQRFIEEKQLLFKIKLLKKELKGSEV